MFRFAPGNAALVLFGLLAGRADTAMIDTFDRGCPAVTATSAVPRMRLR